MSVPIDLLILTALREEAEVVSEVLTCLARRVSLGLASDLPIDIYKYSASNSQSHECPDKHFYIAAACANAMGAVPTAVLATKLFETHKPATAILVGIAASVDPNQAKLGDVVVSDVVYSYDNIEVTKRGYYIRTIPYDVALDISQAVGAFARDYATYERWQNVCEETIPKLLTKIGSRRNLEIKDLRARPDDVVWPQKPTLLTEPIAGGPFLIKEKNFRNSLRKVNRPSSKRVNHRASRASGNQMRFEYPLHSKIAAVEMESHGFMAAAKAFRVRAAVSKGISDDGDKKKEILEKESKGFYRIFACANSVIAALHILPYIPSALASATDFSHYEILAELSRRQFLDGHPVSFIASFHDYAALATSLSKDSSTAYVLWTVNGSPLDEPDCSEQKPLTPWDKDFASFTCSKLRVVIFRNEDERKQYIDATGAGHRERRLRFEESCGPYLRFTSVKQLREQFRGLRETVSFDIGFVSKSHAVGNNSGTCFFSEFFTSEFSKSRHWCSQLVIFDTREIEHLEPDYYKLHQDAKKLLERSQAYKAFAIRSRNPDDCSWLYKEANDVPVISET
jgi:nucleoside phosphorylase